MIEEQVQCVRREIAMRERVYPRWVKDGKMTQDKARHEIRVMKEVLVTLETISRQNELPFDTPHDEARPF